MPSLQLSDGGGQNRSSKKVKAARPLKPSIEPLPSAAASSNGNGSAAPVRDGESAFCRALASGDPSMRLRALDALVAAGKDFEFLMVPGGGHGIGETPYPARRRMDFFVRHLWRAEPRR